MNALFLYIKYLYSHMSFFKDGDEHSMRRLIAFWAMCLLTILIVAIFINIKIDVQVISVVAMIVGVGTGASAVKKKNDKPPF